MALITTNGSRTVSNENNITITESTTELKITSAFYQKSLINDLRKCLDILSDIIENNSIFNNSLAKEFQKEIEKLKNKLESNKEGNGNNLLDLNVCLIGNTGSGKSTLINALLGYPMVPTSGFGEACTKFLWKISYNDTILDNPKSNGKSNSKTNEFRDEFKARIILKKFKEYQEEIGQAFELLSEKEDEKQVINPQIISKKNEAEKLLETLFGPKIIDKNEIVFGPKKITKSMAMSDKSIQERLETETPSVTASVAKDFAKRLKIYLAPKRKEERSSLPTYSSDSNNLPYWPFVKEIYIQGPFEALRNGVILVDVPGKGDINEGRNQIAKNVLDITDHIWIISDIKRALSEKNTANILGDSLRDQLKMTGKYLSRTFICTNSDVINLDDDELEERDELRGEKEELKKEIKIIKEEIVELKDDEYNIIQDENTQLNRTKFGPKSSNNVKINVITTEEKINELEKELKKKNKRLKEIDDDLISLLPRAAKRRNEEVKQNILKFELQSQQNNLEFTKRGANNRDLPVFTVSSAEYLKISDKSPTFQNEEDTEIPKLINHLKEISKINISNKISNIIKHIKVLLESMLRRIDDSILLETPEKRKQAKDKFIKERLNLIGKYRDIVEKITKEFSDEIDNNILKKMSNVGRIEAEKECASIIILRGHLLHHTIWKATVKRNGYYTDGNGVTHNFNADLLDPIMKSVTNDWFIVFNEIPKKLVEQLETQINEVMISCFEVIDNEILKISPNKKKYIEKFQFEIKDNMELKMNAIKEKILNKIRKIQNELQNKLDDAMKRSMNHAYSNAVLEGDWQSMKAYLHTYIENHKTKIFDDTINEFKEQISISIEHLKEYIIGTVFTTLNENSESDYACFWEISKEPNLKLEEKDNFITYVNEIISNLILIQENLNEQLLKLEENGEEMALVKEKPKRQGRRKLLKV